MEEGFHFITLYLEEFTYTGIFLVLILAGFGLPFPEEIVLVLSGYLAFLNYTRFHLTLFVTLSGVLIGDVALFLLGKRWGKIILKHHRLEWLFTRRRLARARRFFFKYGRRTIFIARFLSGIRAPVYLTAGTIGMRSKSFVIMDALAAIVSVPFFVFIGYFFGEDIDRIIRIVRRTEYFILVLLLIIGIFVYLKLRSSKGENREDNNGGDG